MQTSSFNCHTLNEKHEFLPNSVYSKARNMVDFTKFDAIILFEFFRYCQRSKPSALDSCCSWKTVLSFVGEQLPFSLYSMKWWNKHITYFYFTYPYKLFPVVKNFVFSCINPVWSHEWIARIIYSFSKCKSKYFTAEWFECNFFPFHWFE